MVKVKGKLTMVIAIVVACVTIINTTSNNNYFVGNESNHFTEETANLRNKISLLDANDAERFSNIELYNYMFDYSSVIVVLTRTASIDLEPRTLDDFYGYGVSYVKSLSTAAEENVREQLEDRGHKELNQPKGLSRLSICDENYQVNRDTSNDVDLENFRKILSLYLDGYSRENVIQTIRILEERPDIYAVVPNFIESYESNPSDPMLNQQWAINSIQARQAWQANSAAMNNAVNVGVMDTGIDRTHPELVNRVHPNSSFHRDFTGSSVDPLIDHRGHGTHVAGIIGAESNNGTGIAGLHWGTRLVSLRVFCTFEGRGYQSWQINALNHARQMGLPIVNLSGGSRQTVAMEQAVRNFGGLFVHSAGNDGSFLPTNTDRLVSRNIPNYINVGSTTSAGQRSSFSNYGVQTVDIFAPGSVILSTEPGGRFGNRSGTSMAAPQVAGVAAMIYARFPGLSGERLRNAIMRSSDYFWVTAPTGNHWGNFLNAYAAINDINQTAISTPHQLNNIRNDRHSDFFLTQDIDLSTFSNWVPIQSFYGHLDGRGFTIRNLTISIPNTNFSATQNFGLFATLNGSVTNLRVQNANIYSTVRHGGSWVNVGVIAGTTTRNASVSNVDTAGGISIDRMNSRVGGIVGNNYGMIRNSINRANIRGNGDLGGIAGTNRNTGRLFTADNTGRISFWLHGSNPRSVGGIVGFNNYGIVFDCWNFGNLSGENTITAEARIGAIIGHNQGTFNTNNINFGGWNFTYTRRDGILGIGSFNNGRWLFSLHDGRVGRQG